MNGRISRLLLPALGALAALAATAPAASACSNSQSGYTAEAGSTLAASVVCLVNAERTARGLPVLNSNRDLEDAALGHSRDMAQRDYFSHTSQDGTKFSARLTRAGYDWIFAGENIAAGHDTAQEVMKGWMASEGHCENILSGGFTDIGVGVATGPGSYGIYWTQDFGRQRGNGVESTAAAGCPYKQLVVPKAADTCRPEKLRIGSMRRVRGGRLRVKINGGAEACCPRLNFTVKRGSRRSTTSKRRCADKFVVTLRLPRGHGRIVVTVRSAGGGPSASRALKR